MNVSAPSMITRRAFSLAVVGLAGVGRGDRHRQPGDLLRRGVRHDDRWRQRTVAGNVERSAVRHHAGGAAQRKLALLGEVAVDFEMRKTPWVGRGIADPGLQQMLVIAVVLLKMMRPQEQTFRPRHLGVPGHS